MVIAIVVKLELGHVAQALDVPSPLGHTHEWKVFVKGADGITIENFVEKSEPRTVRFHYDMFLHKENMPPVNHTRVEMLTFTNPADDFKKRLLKAGGTVKAQAIPSPPKVKKIYKDFNHTDGSIMKNVGKEKYVHEKMQSDENEGEVEKLEDFYMQKEMKRKSGTEEKIKLGKSSRPLFSKEGSIEMKRIKNKDTGKDFKNKKRKQGYEVKLPKIEQERSASREALFLPDRNVLTMVKFLHSDIGSNIDGTGKEEKPQKSLQKPQKSKIKKSQQKTYNDLYGKSTKHLQESSVASETSMSYDLDVHNASPGRHSEGYSQKSATSSTYILNREHLTFLNPKRHEKTMVSFNEELGINGGRKLRHECNEDNEMVHLSKEHSNVSLCTTSSETNIATVTSVTKNCELSGSDSSGELHPPGSHMPSLIGCPATSDSDSDSSTSGSNSYIREAENPSCGSSDRVAMKHSLEVCHLETTYDHRGVRNDLDTTLLSHKAVLVSVETGTDMNTYSRLTDQLFKDLQTLQNNLNHVNNEETMKKIASIIQKSGIYTEDTDGIKFDLCRLDEKTIRKLQKLATLQLNS
ncbi:uncharacterized protein LOC143446123 isoform X2 [Clavelina lepadiformis]|uniref:uncharacterized protein LOC143446123 isoform X2 n=1 Tax=Clavelina lepadiformis TaxID=159417 RepID=UPI0040430B65